MLILHIIVALLSVSLFSARIFRDNNTMRNISNMSAVSTIVTGVFLVLIKPSAAYHACISGSLYLAATICLVYVKSTFTQANKA